MELTRKQDLARFHRQLGTILYNGYAVNEDKGNAVGVAVGIRKRRPIFYLIVVKDDQVGRISLPDCTSLFQSQLFSRQRGHFPDHIRKGCDLSFALIVSYRSGERAVRSGMRPGTVAWCVRPCV